MASPTSQMAGSLLPASLAQKRLSSRDVLSLCVSLHSGANYQEPFLQSNTLPWILDCKMAGRLETSFIHSCTTIKRPVCIFHRLLMRIIKVVFMKPVQPVVQKTRTLYCWHNLWLNLPCTTYTSKTAGVLLRHNHKNCLCRLVECNG